MAELGVIKDIDKGRNEVIRVEISRYKDKDYLNIRVWYTDKDGELKPTQKGVSIPSEMYEDLKEAIEEAGKRL